MIEARVLYESGHVARFEESREEAGRGILQELRYRGENLMLKLRGEGESRYEFFLNMESMAEEIGTSVNYLGKKEKDKSLSELESIACEHGDKIIGMRAENLTRSREKDDMEKISFISELKRLRYLEIRGPFVGRLPDLSGHQELEILTLNDIEANVFLPDLASFNKKLRKISLNIIGVIGDLSDLSNKIEHLNVGLTGVTGDIKSLSNMKSLEYLNADFTKVTGDIKSLLKNPELTQVSLTYTRVTGEESDLPGVYVYKTFREESSEPFYKIYPE